jgi:hypothetical protein
MVWPDRICDENPKMKRQNNVEIVFLILPIIDVAMSG